MINGKSELSAGDAAHILRAICRFAFEDAVSSQLVQKKWGSRDQALETLREEGRWSEKGLCEHDSEVSSTGVNRDPSDLDLQRAKPSR